MTNIADLEEYRRRAQYLTDAPVELEPELPLKHGGGGGTSGGMDAVDAKIAAAEARTDTKFAELRGDLKDFATAKEMRNTVWGAALTLGAIILAAIAFGGDRFDAGLGMADTHQKQLQRDAEQDAKFDEILKRLPPPKG